MHKLLLLVLVGAGCDGVGRDEPLGGRAQATIPSGGGVYDEEHNGRFVLGARLDDESRSPGGSFFSVPGKAERHGKSQVVSFAGLASLSTLGPEGTLAGTDKGFGGLIFTEGKRRITVHVLGGDAKVTRYRLEEQVGTGPIESLCEDAVVLAGVIDRDGRHVLSPGRFTFACHDGAAHKCTLWGYPAGGGRGGLWGAHEACMQMVTANYCADGAPQTRVGTSIRYYDDVGVHQIPAGTLLPAITPDDWPPDPDDYYFEAAFTGSHEQALCVGKLRWPLLASSCATALPDCPSSVDGLIDPHGAVLFVASTYNQLRLDRWRRSSASGEDRVATVRGYFNGAAQDLRPPWDGYEFEGHDGVLLRVPPASVADSEVVEVSLYTRFAGGDHFVAASDDPRFANPQLFARGFEGFVFVDEKPGLRALRLYRRSSTGERVTTTLEPADMAGLGYVLDDSGEPLIGWIAPAP